MDPPRTVCRIGQGAPYQRQKNIIQKTNTQRKEKCEQSLTRVGCPQARSGSKCLRQGSARGPGEVEFFRRGCLRLSYKCFLQIRVPNRRVSVAKMETKRYQKQSTWNQNGAKVSQGTFKNIPCGTGSNT